MKLLKWFAWILALVATTNSVSGVQKRVKKGSAFRQMFPAWSHKNHETNETGTPLYVTPLLVAGKWKEAQQKAKVDNTIFGEQFAKVNSYSGYFTVNDKACKSNMFFWFFPAQHKAAFAPVLLWLQGGPGGSSMFGLFNEHGPFVVRKDMTLDPRSTAWTLTHNVLYIDNPVGTGFSYTGKDSCYAKNQVDVASDLYEAVQQFFFLFPSLRRNDFYVTGESYAGKYVPALTFKIHEANPKEKFKINLAGMAIGDGLCDPATMTDYGDFLFTIGLIDEMDRDYFRKIAKLQKQFIAKGQWYKAFQVFDDLLNGDLSGHPSYYTNATGFNYYFNYLQTKEPEDMSYYPALLDLPQVRKAIHVGNLTFNDGLIVEKHLVDDMMQSVKPWIQEILEHYKVLIYNGQLDVIIAWPLTESFITSMKWSGAAKYLKTSRSQWHVAGELAGYAKQVGNFTQVLVRNAGHMIPYDQPKFAFDLIHRFTSGKTFN